MLVRFVNNILVVDGVVFCSISFYSYKGKLKNYIIYYLFILRRNSFLMYFRVYFLF